MNIRGGRSRYWAWEMADTMALSQHDRADAEADEGSWAIAPGLTAPQPARAESFDLLLARLHGDGNDGRAATSRALSACAATVAFPPTTRQRSLRARFGIAFGLSLAVHVAFFALLAVTLKRGPAPPTVIPIELTLVERAAAAAAASDAAEPASAPVERQPVEDLLQDSETPTPIARRMLPTRSRPVVTRPAGLSPKPSRWASIERIERIRPVLAPTLGSRATADAAVELAIGDWLKRYQRYPRAARRAGLEGIAQVRFVIDRSGTLRERELVASSGHAVLDRAALELLERAAPYPRLPGRIAVELIELTLPVEYRLRDASRG